MNKDEAFKLADFIVDSTGEEVIKGFTAYTKKGDETWYTVVVANIKGELVEIKDASEWEPIARQYETFHEWQQARKSRKKIGMNRTAVGAPRFPSQNTRTKY